MEDKPQEFFKLQRLLQLFQNVSNNINSEIDSINDIEHVDQILDQAENQDIVQCFLVDDLSKTPLAIGYDIEGTEIPVIDVSMMPSSDALVNSITKRSDMEGTEVPVIDVSTMPSSDEIVNAQDTLHCLNSKTSDYLEIDQSIMRIDDNNNNLIVSDPKSINKSAVPVPTETIETESQNKCSSTANTVCSEMQVREETPHEVDECGILDLSVSRSNIRKPLRTFLQRPPTPKRKGKKFTEKTSFAINSREFKASEAKKIDKKKMELKKKDARQQESLEKKSC